jgi:hypothetical protein
MKTNILYLCLALLICWSCGKAPAIEPEPEPPQETTETPEVPETPATPETPGTPGGSLNSMPRPSWIVSFIDSQGRDLVEGIPTIKLESYEVQYDGDFLSGTTCNVKLFVNDEELSSPGNMHWFQMKLSYKEEASPYDAIQFVLRDLWDLDDIESIYTVRCEMICPYIFGDDRTHTLVGELHGGYMFRKCWFDGVEASPAYRVWEGEVLYYIEYGSFFVQVDR